LIMQQFSDVESLELSLNSLFSSDDSTSKRFE